MIEQSEKITNSPPAKAIALAIAGRQITNYKQIPSSEFQITKIKF